MKHWLFQTIRNKLVTVLIALGLVSPTLAQDTTYQDPAGHFTVPVPTNWTAESIGEYGLLSSPESGIKVYMLSLESTDIDAAIMQAWTIVDPSFALESTQTIEPPAPAGIEAVKIINYKSEGRVIVQAVGRLAQGRVYLMLIDAQLATLQTRASQIRILDEGFQITKLEKEDISGLEPKALTPELITELETFINEGMNRAGVPGLAVSIVRDGEIVYANGFGVREAGKSEPITPETMMMIGSTGKTMTTLFMAQLVDEGLIDWDTPVVDILPEFRVADAELSKKLMVKHLVCACTGVPRRDFEIIFNSNTLTGEAVIESLQDFTFFTEFGEAFQYSNQMVATGGYVAAATDGAAYGNLLEGYISSLEQRIFMPLGMTNTTLRFDDAINNPNIATPHGTFIDAKYQPISFDLERFVIPVAPAGAPWSNVLDMGRYLVMELSKGVAPDGKRIVSEANLLKTREPQVPVSAEASYGLGWLVSNYKGLDLITHGGNTMGFTSDLTFLPTEGIGISILTNAHGSNALNQAIRTRLFELLYDQGSEAEANLIFSLEEKQKGLESLQQQITALNPEALAEFLGEYQNPTLGTAELRFENDKLIFDAGEFSSELATVGEDKYISTTPPLMGLSFVLEQREGVPTLVIGEGVEAHVFSKN